MSKNNNQSVDIVCSGSNLTTVVHIVENYGLCIVSRLYDKICDEYLLALVNVSSEKIKMLKDVEEINYVDVGGGNY
jgi:hypothetical protein